MGFVLESRRRRGPQSMMHFYHIISKNNSISSREQKELFRSVKFFFMRLSGNIKLNPTVVTRDYCNFCHGHLCHLCPLILVFSSTATAYTAISTWRFWHISTRTEQRDLRLKVTSYGDQDSDRLFPGRHVSLLPLYTACCCLSLITGSVYYVRIHLFWVERNTAQSSPDTAPNTAQSPFLYLQAIIVSYAGADCH